MDATTTGAPRATFAITMQYSGGGGAPRLTHDAVVAAVAAVMAAAPLLTCTAAGRVEVPGDARFVVTGTPLPVAAAGVTREARGDWREERTDVVPDIRGRSFVWVAASSYDASGDSRPTGGGSPAWFLPCRSGRRA